MIPLDKPVIFSVATPIGNLDDLTPRAARVLAAVDLIAAEDTRHTRKLLSHLGIHGVSLVSYHDHVEDWKAGQLIERVQREKLAMALVTDAGTPCVSDPGYRIMQAAHAAGVPVCPIPGPSALTALVSGAGLPSDRVLFVGFLPSRTKERESEMRSWRSAGASVVFFEAMRRLGVSLAQLAALYPDARIAIGRELSKLHEELVNMKVGEAQAWLDAKSDLRGEASVMVELGVRREGESGSDEAAALDREEIVRVAAREFKGGASLKDLLMRFRDCGLKRSELYALLLQAKDQA
jgi:16S rRNA (cytidine1402-2'-O)-methyltransferase